MVRLLAPVLFVLAAIALMPAGSAHAIELDPEFGVSGRSPSVAPPGGMRLGWGVVDSVTRPDGSTVVLISSERSRQLALIGFTSDGRIDPSFGVGGRTAWKSRRHRYLPSDLASYPDGSLVVAGIRRDGRRYRASLIRFSRRGRATSRVDGARTVSDEDAVSVTFDAGGRAILATVYKNRISIMRFRRPGVLDRRFGKRGTATATFGRGLYGSAESIAIQPSSRAVVVAAYITVDECYEPEDCPAGASSEETTVLARFSSEGKWDRTFGKSGFAYNGDTGAEVTALADDSLLVSGTDTVGQTERAMMPYARKLTPSGEQVAAFGAGGDLYDPLTNTGAGHPMLWKTSTTVTAGERIWVCGYSNSQGFAQLLGPDSAGFGDPVAAGFASSPDHRSLHCSASTAGSVNAVGLDSTGVSALRYR